MDIVEHDGDPRSQGIMLSRIGDLDQAGRFRVTRKLPGRPATGPHQQLVPAITGHIRQGDAGRPRTNDTLGIAQDQLQLVPRAVGFAGPADHRAGFDNIEFHLAIGIDVAGHRRRYRRPGQLAQRLVGVVPPRPVVVQQYVARMFAVARYDGSSGQCDAAAQVDRCLRFCVALRDDSCSMERSLSSESYEGTRTRIR